MVMVETRDIPHGYIQQKLGQLVAVEEEIRYEAIEGMIMGP